MGNVAMEEAQKYIGYPYVWGGYNPNTSFDCSGFVCWVYTNSGVYNTGRLGTTGLHGACTEVSADMARPGDLVFFEGTMGAGVDGITHVGIYVGSSMMIHCGNPISFADLTGTYFEEEISMMKKQLGSYIQDEGLMEDFVMVSKGVAASYMRNAIDYIKENYCSISGYVKAELGLTDADITKLQMLYTE